MSTSSFYTSSGTSQTLERSVADAAEDAEKLATNPEDSQYTLSDGTTGYSALHYQAKAEDEKIAAQTAKTAAETARDTAQDHRDDAQKLATNAEDSQFTLADGITTGYSALHYYEKALDAKTAAETAKSGAQTSETNAASSAGDAADDAADAQKLAQTAHNTQFTLSDGQTTGFSALHYATEAANTLATFQGQYHGAAASDPTTNLNSGDLYFNTSSGMKAYTGSAWEDIKPSSSEQTNINTLAGISSDVTALSNALGASTTYIVTVVGGVYYLDGVANPILTFDRGNTYIFDLSDSSNTGHPLAFADGSGNSYTTGVTTTGTAGSSGAQVQIDVDSSAPSSLRYYCTVHGNSMGNTITVVNSNLALVASNITSVNTVAGNTTNINTASTNISGINTAANSISAINDFNDIFFAGATAPSSPSNGDLWYDTANSQLKVYVSTQFQIAADYLQGLTTTHIFTATAAQTNFTTDDASNTMNIYSDGNTLVFKNGVRLIEGTSSTNDYYISGNSVILNSGASAGDVLLVEVFTKISLTQETSLNSLVTQAQTSATNAATSATNAASSASAAAADAVSTAADVVSTNADVVSTNADASSTASDRAAAATSATNAANSASAAATSAAQAAASAGGGTLKISGNDTTADVLENKLTAGTGVTLTKNNSGSNETLSVSVTPFSLTETNATATANQTTFSVTYTTGKLQCFKNGVKLISGSDFTATNGTSVVLASGAAAGDIIEFVVFG